MVSLRLAPYRTTLPSGTPAVGTTGATPPCALPSRPIRRNRNVAPVPHDPLTTDAQPRRVSQHVPRGKDAATHEIVASCGTATIVATHGIATGHGIAAGQGIAASQGMETPQAMGSSQAMGTSQPMGSPQIMGSPQPVGSSRPTTSLQPIQSPQPTGSPEHIGFATTQGIVASHVIALGSGIAEAMGSPHPKASSQVAGATQWHMHLTRGNSRRATRRGAEAGRRGEA